jgi:acetyl-CoA carboxylase beta subunit
MSYSTASAVARLDALLDPGTRTNLGRADGCAMLAARGHIGGRQVWIAATDATRARGAIGVAEAEALCQLLRAARGAPAPVFLLLDSAGAKVDEGLAALGAFRRLYREALLTRMALVPMYALLGRACFGGSSMLATLCNLRIYSSRTLLGVSGPGVIQALAGSDQLDAGDAAAVQALMGGEARARLGNDEVLVVDDLATFRSRALELASVPIAATLDLHTKHSQLACRLGADVEVTVQSLEALHRMQQLAPSGYSCSARGDVVCAIASQPRGQPAFVGVLSGGAIGAAASWILADELLKLHESNPGIAVILVLDASGHAATRHDEELLLSEYITHFALTAAWLAAQNHRVLLWLPGQAAGAVYVAFASPAEYVSALPSAQLRILPQAAVQQILRAPPADTSDTETWLRTGVADALLDSRLVSYGEGARAQ